MLKLINLRLRKLEEWFIPSVVALEQYAIITRIY